MLKRRENTDGHRPGAWLLRFAWGCVCLLGLLQPARLEAATNTFLFNYADRSALLADGWSFNATTNLVTQNVGAATFVGVAQNTEITNLLVGGVISYAQTNATLGLVTRVPCDAGTLWGSPVAWTNGTWPSLATAPAANQTRNSLFRNLPTNWVSLRLKCVFAPTQNYQGVGLLLYQDDDNYVDLAFSHNSDTANLFGLGGATIAELAEEAYGFPLTAAAAYIPGTNVTLRLDRDVASQNVSAFFSTNGGTSWVLVGQVSQEFTNTRLGIVVAGSSAALSLSNLPNCDLGEVDIITSDTYTPISSLAMEPRHLVFNSIQDQPCIVTQRVNVVLRPIELPVNWTVTSNATWLSASVGSGQTPGSCDVSVNTAGLTPGIYQGQLSFAATGPTNSPAAVNVTLIVNSNGLVRVSPWKHNRAGAMSVWVDDSDPTAFDDLSTNGLAGTYVMWHLVVPAFYPSYYQAGMELGSHTVDHSGFPLMSEAAARYQFASNILSLVTSSPAPQSQVISLAWPAGVTCVDEEVVAGDYFLAARGYNINQLEDPTPNDFMKLKSYNSHEHAPFPPADLKTVVDAAVAQGKWFNLVLHTTNNDNGAIVYSLGKNIWFATGGTVTKYIYQRDRVVITNYQQTTNYVQFDCYRLPLDPSNVRPFENAIGTNDTLTLTINVKVSQALGLLVNGVPTAFTNNGSLVYFDALIKTNIQTIVLSLGSNSPPVLQAQSDRTMNELTTLTVTNSATNITGQTLTYTLTVTNTVGGAIQGNASISSAGVISWIPTDAQGPGIYRFTTVVMNNGVPPLAATNSFLVTVNEVNSPPSLPVLSGVTLFGQQPLTITNTATDSDVPSNPLGYRLTSAPAGASISPNGIISWTPSLAQVPSTNVFTTVVTDTNLLAVSAQNLSATNSFTVTVQVNPALLPAQTNRTINELTLMRATNTATVLTNLAGSGVLATNSIAFNYPNRAALLADGWSFSAVNANGTGRNTEITDTNVGVVAYAQTNASLGTVLRVPCDTGDIWQSANDTQNALFHSLPTNWVSLRLALAFAPSQDYQQAQLTLYQDDDNYVGIDRTHNSFNSVQAVELSREVNQAAVTLNYVNVTATNLTLRLDRNAATGNIAGWYSLDGINWSSVGQTSQTLTNTQVAVWTGASTATYASTHLSCDFNRLDMIVTNLIAPVFYTLTVTNSQDGSTVTNAAIDGNGIISWTPTEAQGPGQYAFSTVATCGSYQTTNTFTVTVNEINTAPALPQPTNRTLVGLQGLTVTNTASDSDIPANALGYVLTGAPAGAAISTNGVITWTPSVAQVPGVYSFTTIVTDTNLFAVNAQNLKATNTFTVTVQSTHNGPGLGAPTNRAVNELTLLTVTNTAIDTDVPALPLAYALLATNLLDNSAVLNAAITTNGVITWTPTEAQGPGTFMFTSVVTDGSLSATNSFQVTVNEVNTPPSLPAQTNLAVTGFQTLIVTNTATDGDLPANPLGYQLNGPGGASIDARGVITWTPTAGQIPGTNIFTTVVTDTNVYAANVQNLSATNSFTVVVLTPSQPPLALNHSYHAIPGSTLAITSPGVLAGAVDPYGQSLAALLVNGPANGILNLGSDGEFSYVPTNGFTGTDSFTYQASDQFNHSVTATVAITVQPFQILSLNVLNGVASISWSSLSNSSYRVQHLASLADTNWSNLVPDVLATGPVTTFTNNLGDSSQQYYRILLQQ